MSERNVELVRRAVPNLDVFWGMLDEYVVWDVRAYPGVDLGPVHVGREDVIKSSRHYWGTFDDYRVEIEEIIDAGQSVVLVVREVGRGKGSGAPVERRQAQVWTFRDDRIIRWECFPTKADALEAVGVSSSD
jgi:ketosteroid isomerase-like protein